MDACTIAPVHPLHPSQDRVGGREGSAELVAMGGGAVEMDACTIAPMHPVHPFRDRVGGREGSEPVAMGWGSRMGFEEVVQWKRAQVRGRTE